MNEPGSLDTWLFHRHQRACIDAFEAARAPRRRELRIPAVDGVPLSASLWASGASPPTHTVVVASATGVRRGYYGAFAKWLAARGAAVVTFDYRGIGSSKDGGANASMHDWGERDLAGVVAWAAREVGGGAVSVVGHSVGGQLVGLLPEPALVRSIVNVAAQSGDYRLWPLPARLAMAALFYGFVPGVTHAVGYLPGALGIGQDLPPGVALEWARWCTTPGYLTGGEEGSQRRARFAKHTAPLLAFGFDDDLYAPPKAVSALLSLYSGSTIRRRQIEPTRRRIGHFGFFRPRADLYPLWNEAAEFLAQAR